MMQADHERDDDIASCMLLKCSESDPDLFDGPLIAGQIVALDHVPAISALS